MLRYIGLVGILVANVQSSYETPLHKDGDDDLELVFAMAVNRHGDRTPDADELSLSDRKEEIKKLISNDGLEALTKTGKQKAYQIGLNYKKRYGTTGKKLVGNLYLAKEIAIRSTDKERTKMTAQLAMAAMFPPQGEQQWDEGLGKVWQPVPYTAVPLTEDYLRYYSNCDQFKKLMAEAKNKSIGEEFRPYHDLIQVIMEHTGRNFSADPLLFQTLFDLYKSTISLGLEIPEWVKPHMPRLGEAAKLAYWLYFRNDKMKRIGGGVLLNTFLNEADNIQSGNPASPQLRVYSSHDFNVGSLMEVAKVKGNDTIPEYGAAFALELYRSRSTGHLSVLPVYWPNPSVSTPKQLHIAGFENHPYCDYHKFKELTKEFRLPEKEFYQICSINTEL